MNENKYNHSEDSDDDYQEVVVNGSDYREPIYEFESVRDLPIIKCIGQIKSQYNYQIEHDFKQSAVGTGTVYKTRYSESESVVFVLTCAHNIRLKIYSCNVCNTYNRRKECSECNQLLNNKQLLKPTFIEFKRRSIAENNFGHAEKSYTCIEVYVPQAYEKNTILAKGFDFAILMFRDKDSYYTQHCRDIQLKMGTLTLQNYKKFNIFGYPGCDFANVKKNKLYGYAMKTEAQPKGVECVECTCTEINENISEKIDYILRQRHVDASAGQSGSSVFVTGKNNETIIFAVHVGGHKKKKDKVNDYSYNIATLLSQQHIKILEDVTDLYVQHEKVQNLQRELDAAKEKIIVLQMPLKEQELNNDLDTGNFLAQEYPAYNKKNLSIRYEAKSNVSQSQPAASVCKYCIYAISCLNKVTTPSSGYLCQVNGQIYANCSKEESLFAFIECDKKQNQWYIQYKGEDKYKDYWLTYWGSSAYLYKSANDRAVWVIKSKHSEQNQTDSMVFEIICWYKGKYKGGLCKRGNTQKISVKMYESDMFALTPNSYCGHMHHYSHTTNQDYHI